MKHHLRSDKTCLNCGADVTGRFCGQCGQENVEPKETVDHLVKHFVGDITHFDSKFFITLKDLLFRPGFLTKEYIRGRRTRYLDPIRTYIFISVLFFIALFFNKHESPAGEGPEVNKYAYNLVRQQVADSLRDSIKTFKAPLASTDSIRAAVMGGIASSLDSSTTKDTSEAMAFSVGNGGVKFVLVENRYNSIAEFDSVQNTLPDSARTKGILRWMLRTNIKLKEKYGSRGEVILSENFEHNIPKMMFVLLPLFALYIYMLHNKKNYYYAQHVIFSIHYHSFMFTLLLFLTILGWAFPHLDALYFLLLPGLLALFVYLVLAIKVTYNQSLRISLLKSLATGVLYIISLVICIIGLAFINFFTA